MLNSSLFLLSLDELKNVVLHELTIFHVALVYVLMFVVYKTLGRYIYFKPQEHASKINRTFLTLSLLVVSLHVFASLVSYLPVLPEYRWLYVMCGLVLLIAPLSIAADRLIWNYDRYGQRSTPDWHYYYLPIPRDYYKTSVSKSEQDGTFIHSWEDEGVESTRLNIHSDALLNFLALVVFITVSCVWTYTSYAVYGWLSLVFSGLITLSITGIFLDAAVFSWVDYLEKKLRPLFIKQ